VNKGIFSKLSSPQGEKKAAKGGSAFGGKMRGIGCYPAPPHPFPLPQGKRVVV